MIFLGIDPGKPTGWGQVRMKLSTANFLHSAFRPIWHRSIRMTRARPILPSVG